MVFPGDNKTVDSDSSSRSVSNIKILVSFSS